MKLNLVETRSNVPVFPVADKRCSNIIVTLVIYEEF